VDPSEMIAFQYMMKQKNCNASAFLEGENVHPEQFSDSAQRIGVYTAADYIDIMQN
jgi:acyl-[acyl-carrier-protein] desaturase